MWRYHHQVSHHIHCNDDALDEDVFSAFPILRFDARLPRAWYHRFQHIYMWATFPLLLVVFQVLCGFGLGLDWIGGSGLGGWVVAITTCGGGSEEKLDRACGCCPARRLPCSQQQQRHRPHQPTRMHQPRTHQIGDIQALFENKTQGATLYGATPWERATVILGKLAHYTLLLAVPWALHGPAATLTAAAVYAITQVGVLGRGLVLRVVVGSVVTAHPQTRNLNLNLPPSLPTPHSPSS